MYFRIALGVALAFIVSACRTTEPAEPLAEAQPSEPTAERFVDEYTVDEQTSQQIYVRMIGLELKAGKEVPKDRLHSTSGAVECRKRGAAKSCQLRVRVHGEQLSSEQPLPTALEEQVWRYFDEVRADLAAADQALVDLVCDYVGKKSPPYEVEDVSCKLRHPRAVNEVILTGLAAQALSETLQEGEPFTNLTATVKGTLLCTWLSEVGQSHCAVRPMVKNVLGDHIEKISHQQSGAIGKELRRAYFDRYTVDTAYAAVDTSEPPAPPPQEILGRVICVVDSAKYQRSGKRAYSCRVEL